MLVALGFRWQKLSHACRFSVAFAKSFQLCLPSTVIRTKRCCNFELKGSTTAGKSRRFSVQFPPQMPITVHNPFSQTDYGILSTWFPTCDSGFWFHSHGLRCWGSVKFAVQCSPRKFPVKPPTAKASCMKPVSECKREVWPR